MFSALHWHDVNTPLLISAWLFLIIMARICKFRLPPYVMEFISKDVLRALLEPKKTKICDQVLQLMFSQAFRVHSVKVQAAFLCNRQLLTDYSFYS